MAARLFNKVCPVNQAIKRIYDGATIVTCGFVGVGFPEFLACELENQFLESGHPGNLTIVFCAGQGDGVDRGLNHFGHAGLLKRTIGGHYGLIPTIGELAINNEIEAYNFPQGWVFCFDSHDHDIAGGKPRTITHVGLGTFVDPRLEGGKVNERTTEDLIEVLTIDGKDYLSAKLFPIDFALVRGTTADEKGNVTMEKEALILETLSACQAVKNSRGEVIVQVEQVVEPGTLDPRQVVVPGIYVDHVVICTDPSKHEQTFAEAYNPYFSGQKWTTPTPRQENPTIELSDLTDRKIIARRAAMELRAADVVNLGIGVPELVSTVAEEEGVLEHITMTIEPGVIGGTAAGGLNFGCAENFDCLVHQTQQFDFYQGGGLDVTFLGLAECDSMGNLNVSKFGPKLAGCGGFIDISQNAKRAIFMGTLVVGGDGGKKKFVKEVEQRTFSASVAVERGQEVLYVTEKCVFELTENGIKLIEIAPGVDLERDVLPNLEFVPLMDDEIKVMDMRIFQDDVMGISFF